MTTEGHSDELVVATVCGTVGLGRPALRVSLTPYVCAWCQGRGRWNSGERCSSCAATGITDDPEPGVDLFGDYGGQEPPTVAPMAIPRPPAVMRSPCVDCAFRPGSPEAEAGTSLDAQTPFFCHHGMTRIDDGYVAAAWLGDLPLGYMVCASWWALVTGDALPDRPFRDPGGADRRQSAPVQDG